MFFRTITIDFLATDKCLVWQFIWAPFMERPIKQYVLQQFSLISATKRLCPPPCFDLERVAHINSFFLFFLLSSFLFSFPLRWLRESGSYQPFYSTLQPFVFPLSVALSALCFSLYRENKGAADNEHLKHWHINHNLRHYFPTTLNSYFLTRIKASWQVILLMVSNGWQVCKT